MSGKYDDIINLPHHVSKTHKQMSMHDRAAQFSPFAALTGHKEAVNETARLTDRKIELDDGIKAVINEKLRIISEHIKERLEVKITYFEPDAAKGGGTYLTISGCVKKADTYKKKLVMTDGLEIMFDALLEIDDEMFEGNIQ